MLPKYYRLRMRWDADQTLAYDSGARIDVRLCPWKLANGVLSYGTTVTDDLGFGAGESIVDEGQVEGSVIDNTTNKYWGVKGTLSMTANANSTDGWAYLHLEESEDNVLWPSDQADFDINDLRLVAVLPFSTTATGQSRAVNFEF